MVPGYRTGSVNTLRLWSAKATQAFDLQVFNTGDYLQAVRSQAFAENISKVLYPEDSTPQGKELRLQQQYFFVACSIRDYIDNVLPPGFDLHRLPERVIFQLNDTHPVIAIPELMRILVDERGHGLGGRLDISRQCFAYTCHTLLPEALEVWPVDLLGRLLPRHLEIIYRINDEFLAELREAYPDDELRVRRMSIIQEHPSGPCGWPTWPPSVGAKVNGVAELHSQLLRDNVLSRLLRPLAGEVHQRHQRRHPAPVHPAGQPGAVRPDHRHHRRRLARAIWTGCGSWSRYADDAGFLDAFAAIKAANKTPAGRACCSAATASCCRPDAMYDVMVKRLHEYKRQTLKLLHVITLYQRIQENPEIDLVPRVTIFGAKAAPGYRIAKDTIALINAVGPGARRRPDGGRPAADRVPGQLQRDAGRDADPGRRPVRADLAGRQGGVRAPAT